jgi:hypothetical protein
LRGFPNYAKKLGSFGKLRNCFSSLQNMDTLGKKKLCPNNFGHSGKILMLENKNMGSLGLFFNVAQ